MAIADRLPVTSSAQGLHALVQAVAADLVSAEMINGRVVIAMPVLTIGGTQVQVSVWMESADSLIVSDDGGAYHLIASACASETIFTRVAAREAQRHGAHFDGASMLFLRVAPDRLRGAIISMADLTRIVVNKTLEASFAERNNVAQEHFIARAEQAFGNWSVAVNATLIGFSNTEHQFDLVARRDNRLVAIDFFTASAQSISATFLKMSDLARLDDDVRRIAVTPDIATIGSKLALMHSVAHTRPVDISAPDLLRLAA